MIPVISPLFNSNNVFSTLNWVECVSFLLTPKQKQGLGGKS